MSSEHKKCTQKMYTQIGGHVIGKMHAGFTELEIWWTSEVSLMLNMLLQGEFKTCFK